MLVLTRRIDESLMIGDNAEVVVLGVKGGQVRLGIKAPNDVAVHRKELYDKIKNGQEDCEENAPVVSLGGRRPTIVNKPASDDSLNRLVDGNRGNRGNR